MTVILLAAAVLLLVMLLGALNAFKLSFLEPQTTGQIFLYTALSVLAFLLFVTLLVLLVRNILKMLADQRSQVLGSRLRSRMLLGALLISFAPALFMFLFSFGLMNRSIDRWFSQPVAELRENSNRIALDLAHYVSLNARAEAESLSRSEDFTFAYKTTNAEAMLTEIRSHRITLQGGFAIVFRDGTDLVRYQIPETTQPAVVHSWLEGDADSDTTGSFIASALKTAQRTDEPVLSVGDAQFAVGDATIEGGGVIVVGLPMPAGLSSVVEQIRSGTDQYWSIYRERRTVRSTFFLLLLMLSALIFFASSWLALYLSKQITRPVEALADAMNEIGNGRYEQRITISATEELGELIRSFNHMAADLEQSRTLAETSAAQLSAVNLTLETRRKELETILETIPSAVATLDANRCILQANRAFQDIALLHSQRSTPAPSLAGTSLSAVFANDLYGELALLERRAQRMGIAAAEVEMPVSSGNLSLTATIAVLDLGVHKRGSILVIEDVTELLRAQRQLAWKEVAQRVAHEIKNPLTPIALSAERIRRHMDRNLPESANVIRRCVDVILTSVESMSTLVGQFAVLAEFPVAQPRPTDLNAIVESALMLFQGRLSHIRIERRFSENLPPVMADEQSLRRALANLVDNAAEAMQNSLVRVLSIETCMSESSGMAELVLSDTGHGLTDDMRERLFLPYVSTKQRGTGLGLAIAAKIIQEHHGAIRAENNTPAGARFILELPLADNGVVKKTETSLLPSSEMSQ
ncbi:ATP-binding protein [Silvibacterium acidisoli]|uniref:ATP-binding protein n=1 Tax=Acidobacteriaceae bacterium ZG23-2 TaxID=2883246 RepID=UPI00406CB197